MKYIEADKLIAEIERLQKRAEHYEEISLTDGERSYWSGENGVLELLATFITSFHQEQPDGLDEAAEKSAKSWRKNPDGSESREMLFQPHIRGFKAGAEWMAGQMMKEAVEVVVVDDWQYGKDTDGAKPAIKVRNPDWKIGDKKKVIILKEE